MYLLSLLLGLVVIGTLYAITAAKRKELIERQQKQTEARKPTRCHHHCCCNTRT